MNLDTFFNWIATSRNEPIPWTHIHVADCSSDTIGLTIGVLAQVMAKTFAGMPMRILQPNPDELHVVIGLPVSKAENFLRRGLGRSYMRVLHAMTLSPLNKTAVLCLVRSLSGPAARQQLPVQIAVQRLVRNANVFAVLNDNPETLRQAAEILKRAGQVETFTDVEAFFKAYPAMAPTASLIGFDVGGDRGSRIVHRLLTMVDPAAHCAVMSPDVVRDTVLESRHAGAQGFLPLPLRPDIVLKLATSSPFYLGSKHKSVDRK